MLAGGTPVNVSGWFYQKADAKPHTLDDATGWTQGSSFLADTPDDSNACMWSMDHIPQKHIGNVFKMRIPDSSSTGPRV